MKHGKKYIDAAKLIENNKTYDPNEALELCCKTATAKFDETVELHVRLGVDSRHADQQVRGAVVLPNGTGKKVLLVLPESNANLQLSCRNLPYVQPVLAQNVCTYDVMNASAIVMVEGAENVLNTMLA